ncbi:efflux RND transporter periplasmic adaptor subunit [Brevibacterium oceani]|uniref:efflux RND transporter periplasmic adaptor subunit n=1 Tax=Brevibacterium oceani TaxID=358099 RepID=UPI0015E6F33F|nr:efflux RND transporter periplasmic adaptor subunit [Brevibacterium oceani]
MSSSRRRVLNIILAIACALALSLCLVLFLSPWRSDEDEASATQLTGTVQRGTVSSTISASGTVAAKREVDAAFDVGGTVSDVAVAVGDTVEKGDTVASLDTTDLSQAVADAQTALAEAEDDLSAAQSAAASSESADTTSGSSEGTPGSGESSGSGQSGSSEDTVDTAEDAVDDATDDLAEAQDQLAAATLTAPIDGLVIAINGEDGSTVSGGSNSSSGSTSSDAEDSSGAEGGESGTEGSSSGSSDSSGFMTIADVSSMTITAAIPEADIGEVSKKQEATVTFPALQDVEQSATVTAISPTSDSSSSVVTYDTTIELDKVPDDLRIGQSAEAEIVTDSSDEDSLYVVSTAVSTDADGASGVEVVGDDGETSQVEVTTGVVGDEGTEITDGLEEGQTVVIGQVREDSENSSDGQNNDERSGGEGGSGAQMPGGSSQGGGPGDGPAGGGPGGGQ